MVDRHDRHITRIAAAFLSLAGFGFGAYCTLQTENEVGTAAAYFVGLFFSIVAITSGVPRLKIGDNEIDPTSVAVGALAVAEAAKRESQADGQPRRGCRSQPRTLWSPCGHWRPKDAS
ncbi:hypothetical protein ACFV9C_30870 [Kribbella sp. NPDC059898]|uniref:hypothetical protein n=1 Tax=Kribbella sp. NPDC059898 TaxID=3346995 RepID=UPI003664C626